MGVAQRDSGPAFAVLGPLTAVDAGGAPVQLGSARQRAVLAVLLIGPGRPVTILRLVDLLWGSRPPATAATMVHAAIAGLRRSLESGSRSIVTRDGGYVLDVDPDRVDAVRFERLLRQGRLAVRDDLCTGHRLLTDALDLWRGAAFEGVEQAFARDAADRLEGLRLECLELRAEAALALGRHREVAAELEPVVARHRLRERLTTLLMTALYRCGRQADALAVYGALRHELAAELGLEPGPEARRVELAVLRHSTDLDGPVRATPRSRFRSALPEPISEFVGRERDLADVADLLDRRRLVTLTGTGGAGKTRLAVEVARRAASETCFVDLTPLAAGTRIDEAVAAVAGVRTEPGEEPVRALAAALDGQEAVLLLDNCEHLLDACSALVATLLARAGHVRVLATSREPLGVPGEHVHRVRPLPLAGPDEPWRNVAECEAVALFAIRAAAVRPGFAVTPENAGLVRDLCARLDGLPLGLELAAARAASMSLRDLVDRLDQRFSHAAHIRSTDARHRSLDAAIRWSYDLLPPAERALLTSLAVFPATFDLTAAEALAGDVAFALARLVACSTVQLEDGPDGEPRHRLLETTREFARGRLTDTEHARLRGRHAHHFLAVAEEAAPHLFRAGAGPWLALLDRERANLLAALSWSSEPDGDPHVGARLVGCLWHPWDLRGERREGLRWVHAFLGAVGTDRPGERLPLLGAGALLHLGLADFATTEALSVEQLALARQTGDRVWEGDALSNTATVAWARGRFDRAQQLYEDAVVALLAGGSIWRVAMSEAQLARLHRDRNEPDAAWIVATRALVHADEVGEGLARGLARDVLASVVHRWGHGAEAARLVDEALTHYRLVDYREGEASALHLAGRIAREAADDERARVQFEGSLRLCRQIGHRAGTAAALEALADLGVPDGEEAVRLRRAAVALRTEIGVPRPGVSRE